MLRTRVGYTGGTKPEPTYYALGDHTETLEVDYDPRVIDYAKLLEIFWTSHSPVARRGNPQYKAAVFYRTPDERELAERRKAEIERARGVPVTTELLPAGRFYRAEDYHQKYYLRRHADLMRVLSDLHRTEEALTDSTLAARLNGLAGRHGDWDGVARSAEFAQAEAGLREKLVNAARAEFGADR